MLDSLVNNDFLSSIIAFVIVLIPAVIIHELGHLLAAKAVGITVLEFGIGFPPRLLKLFRWGETEFTLNLIPLGGFVRPFGEDMIRPLTEEETAKQRVELIDQIADQPPHESERDFKPTQPVYPNERAELEARGVRNIRAVNEVRPLSRIFFMAAGALANFASAIVVFIIIGLIGVPQPDGTRVFLTNVPQDSALAAAGFQTEDFIETLNGEKFPTSREFFRSLSELTGTQVEVTVQRATEPDSDTLETLTLTFTPDEALSSSLADASGALTVESIQENSPGYAAGMELEDNIVEINGVDLTQEENPFATLQEISKEFEGTPVSIVVIRDGEPTNLELIPRVNPREGQGRIGVGINPHFVDPESQIEYKEGPDQFEYIPLSFPDAVTYGLERTVDILRTIVEFPIRLLNRETQPGEDRIISIVGVSQLGGEFLQESISEERPIMILNFMALISIALGMTNLLPIPALDGGRILFVIIEMVRGKPIAPEREGLIHLIGLAFLLSIGIIFILNDILNPITNSLP
jgi:regulator of sigma E protease